MIAATLIATCRRGFARILPVRLFRNEEPETRVLPDALLLNFEASDDAGWFPVAPFGDHPHPFGMQRLDQVDAEGLVAWANSQPADWPGVPVYAAPAHPADGDTPALAWVKQFRVAGNELQCRPEFSPVGRERILVNKEFKRVTPAWGCIRDAAAGVWRPVTFDHIGLTNKPNIKATRTWVNAEPASAAAILANGGEWWDAFVAKLEALVGSAPSREDAEKLIRDKIEQLWRDQSLYEQLAGLVGRLANSVGAAPDADPDTLVNTVNGLAERALRLERELADARSRLEAERTIANAAVVDRFIALRRVDPAKRAHAIAICNADREAAIAVWDSADAARPARPATVPADPLAGVTIANAAAAGARSQPSDDDLTLIRNAGVALQKQQGLSPEAANTRAWELFRAGQIQTVFQNSERK